MKMTLSFETKTNYVLAKSQIQEIISLRKKFPIIAIEKYDNAEFTQSVFYQLMGDQAELGFTLKPIRRHIYGCGTETVFSDIYFGNEMCDNEPVLTEKQLARIERIRAEKKAEKQLKTDDPDIISSELQQLIYITSLDKIKKALVDMNYKGRMNTNKMLLNMQLLQNLDINKQKELINKLSHR